MHPFPYRLFYFLASLHSFIFVLIFLLLAIFIPVALEPISDPGRLIFQLSRSRTIGHTQTVGTLRASDQLFAEAATYTKHNKHETNIRSPSGIRTLNPGNRAVLRPHGHRDRTPPANARPVTLLFLHHFLS